MKLFHIFLPSLWRQNASGVDFHVGPYVFLISMPKQASQPNAWLIFDRNSPPWFLWLIISLIQMKIIRSAACLLLMIISSFMSPHIIWWGGGGLLPDTSTTYDLMKGGGDTVTRQFNHTWFDGGGGAGDIVTRHLHHT